MLLFIDTADVAQIKEAWSWGIIDGATTMGIDIFLDDWAKTPKKSTPVPKKGK